MAPHSSTFAWKIPWMEEPGRLQSMGSLESDMTEQLDFHFSLSCIGEGNGSPLQCSCLENPRDGEAWWAAVYGVAQSRTRLKRLSSSSSSSSIMEQTSILVFSLAVFCIFAVVVCFYFYFQQGELIYVNYARTEDFFKLEREMNINCTGKIVIARYGRIFRGNKVLCYLLF